MEHQLQGNRAQQFGIGPRIAQIHELELIAQRQLARRFHFFFVNDYF
jgi:hypothetical protein